MIPLTWLKLSSDILHSKETENDKNKNKKTCGQSKGVSRARQNMWTEQKDGQGSPKHIAKAKGWAGFAKTHRQSKRLDRVRQNIDREKGWTWFAKT